MNRCDDGSLKGWADVVKTRNRPAGTHLRDISDRLLFQRSDRGSQGQGRKNVDQAPLCRFSIMSVTLLASSVITNGLVITSMPASR